MTPINFIAWYKTLVYTVDFAGIVQPVAAAIHEDRAEWLAWSLACAHGVESKKLAAAPLMRMDV